MKALMHPPFRALRLAAAIALAAGPQLHAAIISEEYPFNVNQTIPDGSPVGIADTRYITTDIISITDITVSIEVLGGFNGDLYAYLSNGSDIAILLNRSGRTADNPPGYADEGYSVTFSDAALNGDIHLYQDTLDPMFSPITGTWQPSARDIDPALSLDTISRTAFLSTFQGTNPNGNWTLYFADIESGGVATFESWSLQITGVIPEPSSALLSLLSGSLLLLLLLFRRSRR